MSKALCALYDKRQVQQGFTLVELVIVISVLGILSVVIAPRFVGSNGYSEFNYRNQLLSALRNLQQKAMFDTRAGYCFKMILKQGSAQEFGPTVASYQPSSKGASCDVNIDSSAASYLSSGADVLNDNGLTMTAFDSGITMTFVQFNSLGQVTTDTGRCTNTCVISFTGINTASLCVESEGYVHEC